MGKSIAAEINLSTQGTETQSENVNFDVYLDEVDKSVKEKSVDINSDELKLYVSVNVQDGGYLNNPVIELTDTNFEFKNNPEITNVKLDSIQSEKGTTAGIPIVAKKDESYNLCLLDMQSQIKLTGEYIDADGNVTDIDTTKAVKIKWTADELTKEDIELSQEVITNKIYNIEGTNKRVVQLLVKSKIKDNKAPVKSSIIEITNPQIGGTTPVPAEVKVASYGTEATNGKNSEWSSTSAEGKTTITTLNTAVENVVSWKKNCEDIFVLTYIYDYEENENVEMSTFVSDVKNTVELYGETQGAKLEATNQLPLEKITEKGNIVNLETSITKDIYKGKMYLREDTNYQTKSKIYVPYSEIVDVIMLSETSDEIAEGVSTAFKTTKINKADAIKVLGEEGIISIFAEDITTPIKTINLATEEIEGDYYTVQYTENVSKINITMANAQKSEENIEINPLASEGIIEIINEKVIKVEDTEAVAELTELKSNVGLQAIDSRDSNVVSSTSTIPLVAISNTKTANLLEPKTTFNISLDKTSLSTQTENELRIAVELMAQNESHKLFEENSTINIELPEELSQVSIENVSQVVGNNELGRTHKLKTNSNGNKVIEIKITGGQTKYSSNSAIITIDLKVKTDEFVADKDVEIKATCINAEETIERKETIQLKSKSGLVTKNTIKVGTNIIQEVNSNNLNATITESTNVTITSAIINNFGENISNINIVGNIPDGITLKNAILSDTQGVSISYSEDLITWRTEVADYSKIKSFKLTVNEMAKASLVDLKYDLNVNLEEIEKNKSLTNDLSVNFVINEQVQEERIAFTLDVGMPETPQQPEIPSSQPTITIIPRTKTNSIYEGQIITYEIKVKNTTTENLTNVILDYTIPEGTVATKFTHAQGADITFTDDNTTKNEVWEIEEINPNQTITKEITLKIKQGATEIINSATLKDEQDNIIAKFQSEPIGVNEGKLSALLSRRANIDIELAEGNQIIYVILVTNNTNYEINNLIVTSKVPELTSWISDSEYNTDWNYNESTKNLTYTIDTLKPGETRDIRFEVQVNNFKNNITSVQIDNSAVVTIANGEQYETNIYTSNVLAPKWDINMTASHNTELNEGDTVKYIITVKNSGKRSSMASVEDILPDEIELTKLIYYTDKENKVEISEHLRKVYVLYPVEVGQTLTIEVEGIVCDLDSTIESKQISNVAKLNLGDEEYLESQTIVNTIVNDTKKQPDNSEDKTDSEGSNKYEKYSISGLAWLDENKNGIRENKEKTLELIEVILLDNEGNEVAKTITSLTGTYKFNNLDKGEYIVRFIYDTEKYVVAKYQVEDANETNNSDAISKKITLDNENKTVGITDTIKLNDENITNIDIGLVENPEFDLSLNKYISKVVVTNEEGTATYTYEDTELAKVEIGAKYISGSVLLVEYEIEISNDGDVNGYVTDIIDYLPKELEFNSEMNTEWYLGTDNYLHYMALEPQPIEPGKTQTVKLVLSKTLKSDNTGTIENTAEIAESESLEGIKDIDSMEGNKKVEEDDIGKASLIVSIRTGSPLMYIGMVIIIMLVLGLGIFIINKKVLRVRI